MNFLKKKSFLIVLLVILTILVGWLYVAPPLAIFNHFDNSFLINRDRFSDEMLLYAPRAREVADGHFAPVDFFFKQPLFLNVNPLPPLLLGGLTAIFDDINIGYLAALFLFSGLIFLLFYALGVIIFEEKLWGVFIGLVGILTPLAIHLPRALFGIDNALNIFLKNFVPVINTPLDKLFLARFEDPLLTYPFYLPAIIFLYLFWKRPRPAFAVLSGLSAGLLFYVYFHYWFFWVVVWGLLFFSTFFFLRQDRLRWRELRRGLGVLVIIAIPYLINYFQFHSLPSVNDFLHRFNVQFGRFSNFDTAWRDMLVYLALATIVYFVYFKKDKPKAVLFWCFLGAALLVWNTQLVFGYVPSSEHWRRTVSPIIFLITLDLLSLGVKKISAEKESLAKVLPIALIVLSFLLIGKKIANWSVVRTLPAAILEEYPYPREVIASLDWIKERLPREPKVVSPSFITGYYLLSYTSARPLLAEGILSVASNRELEDRFLLVNKVFGISPDVVEARLRGTLPLNCTAACYPDTNKNLRGAVGDLYGEYFRNQTSGENAVPEAYLELLLDRYRKLKGDWQNLGAEYVYSGPWEKQFTPADLGRDKQLQLIYENSQVSIYKVIN